MSVGAVDPWDQAEEELKKAPVVAAPPPAAPDQPAVAVPAPAADLTPSPPPAQVDEWDVAQSGLQREASVDSQLKALFDASVSRAPDAHAGVVEIATRTGLDPRMVEEQYPLLKQEVEKAGFDPKRFREQGGDVAQLVMQAPWLAPVAMRDEKLSEFTRIIRGIARYGADLSKYNSPETLGARATARANGGPVEAPPEFALPETKQVPTVDSPLADKTGLDRVAIFIDAWGRQRKQSDISHLGTLMLLADSQASDAEHNKAAPAVIEAARARAYELRKQVIQKQQELGVQQDYGQGPIEQLFLDVVDTTGSEVDAIKGMGWGGALGAALLGVPTALASRGNVAATVGAARIGAKLGMPAGAFVSTLDQEGGSAYLEFLDQKDDEGKPMDPAVARGAAVLYGVLAAGVEVAELEYAFGMFGPLGEAVKKGEGRAWLKAAMQDTTKRGIFKEAAKAWAKGAVGEGIEEAVQQTLQFWIGHAGQTISAGGKRQKVDWDSWISQSSESFYKAAVGTAFGMGVGGASVNVASRLTTLEANRRAAGQVAAIAGLQDSPTARAAPAQVAQLITSETERSGQKVEALYLDPAAATRLFQSQDVNPDQAADQLLGPGGAQRVREAMASGGKIEIPLAEYLEKIGTKPIAEALAADLATRPGGLTLREQVELETKQQGAIDTRAKSLVAAWEQAAQEGRAVAIAETPSAARMVAAVQTELLRTGKYKPKEARTAIATTRAFLETQAEAFGIPVEVLFDKYATKVEGQAAATDRAVAAQMQGPAPEGERVIDLSGPVRSMREQRDQNRYAARSKMVERLDAIPDELNALYERRLAAILEGQGKPKEQLERAAPTPAEGEAPVRPAELPTDDRSPQQRAYDDVYGRIINWDAPDSVKAFQLREEQRRLERYGVEGPTLADQQALAAIRARANEGLAEELSSAAVQPRPLEEVTVLDLSPAEVAVQNLSPETQAIAERIAMALADESGPAPDAEIALPPSRLEQGPLRAVREGEAASTDLAGMHPQQAWEAILAGADPKQLEDQALLGLLAWNDNNGMWDLFRELPRDREELRRGLEEAAQIAGVRAEGLTIADVEEMAAADDSPELKRLFDKLEPLAQRIDQHKDDAPSRAEMLEAVQRVVDDEMKPAADPVPDNVTRLFQAQNLPEWEAKTRAWMENQGRSKNEIERHLAAVRGMTKIFAAIGPVELEMLPRGRGLSPGPAWTKDNTKVGKRETPVDHGPIRSNQDPIYKLSFDASAMCVKRLEAAATATYVVQKLNAELAKRGQAPRDLSPSERTALTALFRESGKTAPCLYCYVESPRAKAAEFVSTAVSVAFGEEPINEAWAESTQQLAAAAQAEVKKLGLKRTQVDPTFFTDPSVADSPEQRGMEEGAPAVYAFMRAMVAAAKQNAPKPYEEYTGEILHLPDELIAELNSYAGFRFFSTSDFQAEHVVDLIQAFFDLSLRKAKSHAYTKVVDYVEIFGKTGQKIQTSIFAQRDASGAIVEDDWQGMGWEDAKRLRGKFENVGTVLVATDDEIVRWGLDQPWVDYIIPFHMSGMEKRFFGEMGWKDFSSKQVEKWSDPEKHVGKDGKKEKVPKIRMHELRAEKGISNEELTKRYLALTKKRGLTPVFPQFADHPQFAKLKKDYARTDSAFLPVQPTFNMKAADKVLQGFFSGDAPTASVDKKLATKLLAMIKAAEGTDVDIGVEALKAMRAKEDIVTTIRRLHQSGPAPLWASAVEQALEKIPRKKGSAESWLNAIRKQPGVKDEELQWLGLADWLKDPERGSSTGGEILKDDIQAYVASHRIEVREQMISGSDTEEKKAQLDRIGELSGKLAKFGIEVDNRGGPDDAVTYSLTVPDPRGGESISGVYGLDDFKQAAKDRQAGKAPERLEAVENLSEDDLAEIRSYAEELEDLHQQTVSGENNQWEEYTLGGHKQGSYRVLGFYLPGITDKFTAHTFGDDAQGLMSWVRFVEHTDADGKRVLFVEEMQSDLHQRGAKGGYSNAEQGGIVPDAPFKGSGWETLIAKRMLRWAVDNGYDRLGWTTGEQQADRYNLAKHVTRLVWKKSGTSGFTPADSVERRGAGTLYGYDGKKVVIEQYVPQDKLSEYIGEAAAARLLAAEPQHAVESGISTVSRELAGEDLTVGGDGMAAAYDKRIPDIFSKLLGKGAVRQGEINPGNGPAMAPAWIADISPAVAEQTKAVPQRMFQAKGQERAWVDIVQTGVKKLFKIFLTERADFSSFQHELAHTWLEMMGDLSERPDAPARVKETYADALAWLGVKDRSEIGTPEHEKFAQAFEAYLMRGEAPSLKLVKAFTQLRLWLMDVYKQVTGLGIQLDPKIVSVFDRLLATDREIERMQQAMGADQPLFRSPADAGMTPEEFQGYLEQRSQSVSKASLAARRRVLQAEQQATEAWWKEGLEAETKGAEEEYDARADVRAWRYLKRGEMKTDDGRLVAEPGLGKLDRAKVEKILGTLRITSQRGETVRVRTLDPRVEQVFHGRLVAEGEDPDEVATRYGFATGKEMLEAVLALPNRDNWTAERGVARMREKHPALLDERAKLTEEVTRSLHSEGSSDWLLKEFEALRAKAYRMVYNPEAGKNQAIPKALITGEVTPIESISLAAKMIVQKQGVAKLDAGGALRAERAAAERSAIAAAKGDFKEALVQKQQQLLNHYLWRELDAARERRDGFETLLEKLADRKRRSIMGLGGKVFLDAADMVLEALGAKPLETDPAAIADRQTWPEVMKALDDAGIIPAFASDRLSFLVANPPQAGVTAAGNPIPGWKALSVADMDLVGAALAQLYTAARDENRVRMEGKLVELQGLSADMARELERRSDKGARPGSETAPTKPHWWSRQRLQVGPQHTQGFLASLTDPEVILRELGPTAYKFFWGGYLERRTIEDNLTRKISKFFVERWDELPKDLQKLRYDLVDATDLPLPADLNRDPGTRDRQWMWMVFLNMGNRGNMERLLGGYGWDEKVVRAWLQKNMTKAEVEFLQSVWDLLDKELYPEVAKAYEQINGIKPEKIEAVPFQMTFDGAPLTLRGGYFPARYDPVGSRLGQNQSIEAMTKLYGEKAGAMSVSKSFTKERAKKYTDVINLQWNTVPGHVASVIHYVAFDAYMRDAARVLYQPDFKMAIERRAGNKYFPQLEAWLRVVGSAQADAIPESLVDTYTPFTAAKSRFVTSTLGYSLGVAAGDLTNPLVAMASGKVKARYLVPVLMQALVPLSYGRMRRANLAASTELTHRSEQMRTLLKHQLAMVGKQGAKGKASHFLEATRESAWVFMEATDRLCSTVMWEGAHRQAIDEGMEQADALAHADAVVRSQLPSHDAAEQPAFLRDKRGMGSLMAFYGYFAKLYNVNREIWDEPAVAFENAEGFAAHLKIVPGAAHAAGRTLAVFFMASVVGELLSGRGPEGDEDMPEWVTRKMLAAPFGMFPWVGAISEEAANRIVSYLLHGEMKRKRLSIRGAPAAAALESLLLALGNAVNDERDIDQRIWDLLEVAGLAFKTPLGAKQVTKTGRYLTSGKAADDVAAGRIPETVGGAVYGERDNQPLNPGTAVQNLVGR